MKRLTVLVVALALTSAACGGAADADVGETTTTTAAATTTTKATTTTSTTEATTTTTAAPTTTTTEASGIVEGADPEVDAIVVAYTIALDSVAPYEDKAPYIDDPDGLEDTVAQYLATGESMGGIGVAVSAVTIEGDTAKVTYDLLFGGNPTYPDLSGDAVKTADGWKITRAGFCSLMSSARVGCP